MVLYAVIMFLTAALIGGVGMAIYRGKTNLIHDYHQTKVTDKAAYGKAFGKAMSVMAVGMLISGIVGLAGASTAALVALFVGLAVGIACIVAVQIRYNNGMF